MPGTTPALGDLLQIRTVCYTPQQISMNVLHYEVAATAGVPLTLNQIALLFEARVHAAYRTLMPNTAKWRGCDVRNVMPPATLAFASIVSDGVGLTGTVLAPTQSSYLIRTQAAFAGRKYIGHVYPGFITTTNLTVAGGLTLLGLGAVDDLRQLICDPFVLIGDTGQVSLSLTIRHPNTLGPVVTPIWTRIASSTPSSFIATQRRRGEFGALNSTPF